MAGKYVVYWSIPQKDVNVYLWSQVQVFGDISYGLSTCGSEAQW